MSAGVMQDVALLALFARNVAARPGAIAIAGTGRSFTYAEASGAMVHLAQQIAALNLPPRSSVALLLPNGHELVLTLLAVMQAGHVAVPMPVAWRKSDLVRACREAEAAAFITTVHFEFENLPELAAEVAIEVFELSFPCAFGAPLPDGILPLQISTEAREAPNAPILLPGIGTMQATPGGTAFVLHRDEELLAAGLGTMLSAEMQNGDEIVSALALSSLAALTAAFVPWLLCGGTLTLLSDFPPAGALKFDERGHFVAPASIAAALLTASNSAPGSLIAVHFAGTAGKSNFALLGAKKIVDVIAFGEVCALALPRSDPSRSEPIPLGAVHAANAGAGAPVILETAVNESGRILVRGASVSADALDRQEWLDTGHQAKAVQASSFHAGTSAGIVTIGTLRFGLADLERRILSAALVSAVEAVEDALLGQKLVVRSERPGETARELIDAGLPRVIANAVQKTDTVRARSA